MAPNVKSALKCLQAKTNWTDLLPTVLLGLRASVREETLASPSEFMFGTTLRLPGEFFSFGEFDAEPAIFLESYRQFARELQPIPASHRNKARPFIYKDLFSCSHVFLRRGEPHGLDRPYEGPFKVVKRLSEAVFTIDKNGSLINVSIERLKPAFLENFTKVDRIEEEHGYSAPSSSAPVVPSQRITPGNKFTPTCRTYPTKKRVTFVNAPQFKSQ